MQLPPTTSQQEKIINYLYQFRYLLVTQFQKLMDLRDKKWIQELLTDLVKSKYIHQIKNEEIAKGFVYCLDTRAGHILKKDNEIDETFLGRLYKEKQKEPPFIKEQIFICDIFLHFLSKKQKGEEINFFTAQEQWNFDYFPDPKPSAYIELIDKKETNRYFLEYFDEYSIHKAARNRVQYYLDYCQNGDWQSNTDEPFPMVIFILPTEKFKKHIQYYSNAVFEKNLGDDIDLYLTTKNEIKTGQVTWDGIEIEKK